MTEIRQISIDQVILEAFQRGRKPIADEIVRNFNEALFRPLETTPVGEYYSALDGGQRWRGGKDLGLAKVSVRIHPAMSYEERARLHGLYQRKFAAETPYDHFVCDLEAGEPWALDLDEIAQAHGLEVAAKEGPHHIRAIKTAEGGHKTVGREGLWFAFNVLLLAWPDNPDAYSSALLSGMIEFYKKYRDRDLDVSGFADRLRVVTPDDIRHAAAHARKKSLGGGHGVAIFVRRELVTLYDKGRRTRRLEPRDLE